ncbi:MAG: hypothetical protein V4805_13550 [Pseudomonadota bacterium]
MSCIHRPFGFEPAHRSTPPIFNHIDRIAPVGIDKPVRIIIPIGIAVKRIDNALVKALWINANEAAT